VEEHPIMSLNQEQYTKNDRDDSADDILDFNSLTVSFFKSLPGALIFLDSRWRIVYLNDQAKKLFGISMASLMGRTLKEAHPKNMGHILSPTHIETLLKDDNSTTSYSNYFNKWFKVSAYSSDKGIFIRLEDVTKEMMVSHLLRLNEYSVNNAKDMVFWITPGGRIIYANLAMLSSMGHTMKELRRLKIDNIDPSFVGDNWSEFVYKCKNLGPMTYESSLHARDGSLIPVEVTCNYLEYSNDEYLIAFARNIKLRKEVEQELVEAKDHAELYLDLMGHDMSNMHQIMEAQLELAQEIMAEKCRLEGDEKELIDTPLQTLKRSNLLIENVRKLQQMESGQYKTEPVDISEMLGEVVATYSCVPGKDISIDHNLSHGRYVRANPLLKDVFNNLVDNAVKHSNGPIHISISVDEVTVDGQAYYRVSVEDNGPGIPDLKKKEIFNRLKRGQTTARGVGLGLYIVKALVESFHGGITVEDRVPGDHTKGSRFVVSLPAAGKAYDSG
jgi:PAS domain S-box-containing protein